MHILNDRPYIGWPLTLTRPVIGTAGGAAGSAPGIPLTFLFILPLTVLLLQLVLLVG